MLLQGERQAVIDTLVPRLPGHAQETLHRFLRAHVGEAGAKGVVVGVSGGIDSALVLRLCKDALGPSRVWAISIPDGSQSPELRDEIAAYVRDLEVEMRVVPLAPLEEPFLGDLVPPEDRLARGNLKARLRMVVWYQEARRREALVAGTGNKSELLLGYFTKYGDGGVDLLPIGDLYKTGVRELSATLGLPRAVLERPPSAGLWEGQTDEQELGMPYEQLDRILFGLERLLEPLEIASLLKIELSEVQRIVDRVAFHRHKRRPPPIPKLSLRTLGLDWRD